MPDITLTVSRESTDEGDTYYLVGDGNIPSLKKNFKVTWEPANGGAYTDGTFSLLGVGRYDSGPFELTQIDVDATAGTVSAKAKNVSTQTPVKYLLLVLETHIGSPDSLVYIAYGGPPVIPLVGGEPPPKPPPEVIIDP